MKVVCRFFLLFLTLCSLTAVSADEIRMAQDLALESKHAEDSGMVYLLYVSRPGCPYCEKLEKNVLFPMRVSKTYVDSVDLYELSFEGADVVDFDHKSRSSIDIVKRLGIIGTPTLLFLDGSGAEIAARIVGYHSEDFYWHYFEQAIETALETIDP